jgi:hypothetical protein
VLKRMISAVLVAMLVAMMTAAPAFAQLPVTPSQNTGLGTGLGEIEGCFAGEVGLPLLATIVFQLGFNCEEAAPAQK